MTKVAFVAWSGFEGEVLTNPSRNLLQGVVEV